MGFGPSPNVQGTTGRYVSQFFAITVSAALAASVRSPESCCSFAVFAADSIEAADGTAARYVGKKKVLNISFASIARAMSSQ